MEEEGEEYERGKSEEGGEMTVKEAGHKGGQKVKRLIEEGEEMEEEHVSRREE